MPLSQRAADMGKEGPSHVCSCGVEFISASYSLQGLLCPNSNCCICCTASCNQREQIERMDFGLMLSIEDHRF